MINSVSGKNIISKIPKYYVLTETDGPFVAENNSALKPGQVYSVINFLAKEWVLTQDEVKKIIWENFMRLITQIK